MTDEELDINSRDKVGGYRQSSSLIYFGKTFFSRMEGHP